MVSIVCRCAGLRHSPVESSFRLTFACAIFAPWKKAQALGAPRSSHAIFAKREEFKLCITTSEKWAAYLLYTDVEERFAAHSSITESVNQEAKPAFEIVFAFTCR
ncbi:unnamed protein product [Prorocentrum cordatum]|uniref:Uncharacterized protein n=1 Tax=Prorocentrum cordatum TaxID=2364126 RepID=A0ABN9WB11_9DINO|nr:unnamed protein product [Polarella glacialis]